MLWCHAYRVRTGAAQMTHARQPFHNFWWPEARYARPIFYGCAMAAHTLAFSHALAGASHAAEGGLRAFAHCLFPLWVSGDCSVLLGDAGRRLEQHRLGCGRVRLDLVSGVLAAFRVGLKFTRGDAKEQAHRGERDRRARRADGAAACRADLALISVGISLPHVHALTSQTTRASATTRALSFCSAVRLPRYVGMMQLQLA